MSNLLQSYCEPLMEMLSLGYRFLTATRPFYSWIPSPNRDRGADAPLPHHRTCGSASGGSVKCDEFGIVSRNSSVRILTNRCCSMRDVPAAIWTFAMAQGLYLQHVRPSILKPLVCAGSRVGSAVSSIVSTLFVASDGAAMRQIEPYVFGYPPMHNN